MVKFSRITGKTLACKRFWLEGDELQKQVCATLGSGKVEIVEASDLAAFVGVRKRATSFQAFTYGTPSNGKSVQTFKSKFAVGGAIARTRKFFSFAKGPGIFFIDVDEKGRTPHECDGLLARCFPAWSRCQRVWLPSSSSFIRKKSGEVLLGPGGWRAYAIIDEAERIPDLTRLLHFQLWEIGEGRIVVGKAGQRLDRSLIDRYVSTAEHLDFVAEPELGDGLERFTPDPLFIGSGVLTTEDWKEVLPYQEWKASNAALAKAWEAAKGESLAKTREAAKGLGIGAEMLGRIHETGSLPPNFPVRLADGSSISVALLLERGTEDFDGETIPDPIEPSYDNGRLVAKIYLDENPCIFSFKGGGIVYRLSNKLGSVSVHEAKKHEALRETLGLMRSHGSIYQTPDSQVMLRIGRSGRVAFVSEPWLSDFLDGTADWSFSYFDAKKLDWITVNRGCPDWMPKRLLAQNGNWKLKPLKGVITAPTLRLDGSILRDPGYDEATGLYLQGAKFPALVTGKAEALAIIMEPARLFPFASEVDRAVYVTAVFAGVMRKVLPTCPAFIIDAPQAGTGKTFLGFVIQEIATGNQTAIMVKEDDKAELQKQIDSELLAASPCIFFDNVSTGSKIGGKLDGLLTSKTVRTRIMGGNQTAELGTQTLILLSANNFQVGKDLWRRVLKCRLDAKCEAPERRNFPFDARALAKEKRQQIVAAALGLLKAFHKAGRPRQTADSMASYDEFDGWIRQCVIWAGLEDPLKCQAEMKEENPMITELRVQLPLLCQVFGAELFTAEEVLGHRLGDLAALYLPEDAKTIATWLGNRNGIVVDGLCLRKADKKHPINRRLLWFVEDVSKQGSSK